MCDWNDEYLYTSPRIRVEREVRGLLHEVEFWKNRVSQLNSWPAQRLRVQGKLADAEKRLASVQATLTAPTNV